MASKAVAVSSISKYGNLQARTAYNRGSAPNLMRDLRIDALRGVVLVVMTLSHLPPSPFHRIIVQPLGIVHAAEGFVFLSGIVTAWLMGRLMLDVGPHAMMMRASRRAGQLYVTHMAMITIALLGASKQVLPSIVPSGTNALRFWLGAALFHYQPHYLDILPMYVCFLCLTPLVLPQLAKGRGALIAFLSVALWALSWEVPRHLTGEFNVFAWQLVFVVGVMIGFWRLLHGPVRFPRSMVAGALVIAAVLLVVRHADAFGVSGLIGHPFTYEIQRRHLLTPIRIVNFAALALIVASLPRRVDALVPRRLYGAFSFLGQHSLQVFCWSIAATYVAHSRLVGWDTLSSTTKYAVATTICVTLFLPAWLHVRYRQFQHSRASDARLVRFGSNCISAPCRGTRGEV